MANTVELIPVEGGLSIVFTPEQIQAFGLRAGETLEIAATPAGFAASRSGDGFEDTMAVAERIMQKRHVLLRKLAE